MALPDGVNWNESVPTDSTVANQIDDYMRDMLMAVRSRMAHEHVWSSNQTATSEAGFHRYISFQVQTAAPAIASVSGQVGILYIQTNSATGYNVMYERSNGTAVTLIDGTDNMIPSTLVNTGIIPSGAVIQTVSTEETGLVTGGTTSIPIDDSKPQITEGYELMSLSITPSATANQLRIDVVTLLSATDQSRYLTTALFLGTTADAIACVGSPGDDNTSYSPTNMHLTHIMTASTTGAITFSVRGGADANIPISMNGIGGNRKYGGAGASSIVIQEIKA